jgi:hypothetical protein
MQVSDIQTYLNDKIPPKIVIAKKHRIFHSYAKKKWLIFKRYCNNLLQ